MSSHQPPVSRKKKKTLTKSFTAWLIVNIFLFVLINSSWIKSFMEDEDSSLLRTAMPAQTEPVVYPACTQEQRSKIMSQLLPSKCNDKYPAYFQLCSFTQATKCPNSTWYDSNFDFLRKRLKEENTSFVGVYVGCNKGYDAINTLRMGTGNKKYTKEEWRGQMKGAHKGVCAQDQLPDVPFGEESLVIDGTVHCIEPMPKTAQSLKASAKNLGWDDELLVKETAISNTNGLIYFPHSDNKGVENMGIANCEKFANQDSQKFEEYCREVSVMTLDNYIENEATKKDEGRIHLLSIDVEGYDFDVMKAGTRTLARTEYLEFEYNWMGSWGKQRLLDATKMLDDLGFTCYWAGEDRLWRLDDSCWLDHYHHHGWSNVACVNRELNREVARNMEKTFYKTLEETNVSYGSL